MNTLLAALKDTSPESMALRVMVLFVTGIAGFATLAIVETGQWIILAYAFSLLVGCTWLHLLHLELVKRTKQLGEALVAMTEMAEEFTAQAQQRVEELEQAADSPEAFGLPMHGGDDPHFFIVGDPQRQERMGQGFRWPDGKVAVNWIYDDSGLSTYDSMDDLGEDIKRRIQRKNAKKVDESMIA